VRTVPEEEDDHDREHHHQLQVLAHQPASHRHEEYLILFRHHGKCTEDQVVAIVDVNKDLSSYPNLKYLQPLISHNVQ
jgi:hypothetical protein